jgi:hypothetical protein
LTIPFKEGKTVREFLIALAIFVAMAGNAIAQDLTVIAGKEAGDIMTDDWDGLSASQKSEIIAAISEGTEPLKIAAMYNSARGGQDPEILSALSESSTLKILEALNNTNKIDAEKLIQGLPIGRLEKFLAFTAQNRSLEPKLAMLEIASEGQLKSLLPKTDAGLLAELIANSDDKEVITVIIELMQGKCRASTARARKSSSRPKPKPKPEDACKDASDLCQTPILPTVSRTPIKGAD